MRAAAAALAFLAALAPALAAAGGWEFLGPVPDAITGMSDPSRGSLLVSTQSGGVFRSEDGGETWDPVTAGLPAGPGVRFSSIANDAGDSRVFYMAGQEPAVDSLNGNLLRSVDGGRSWAFADTGLGGGFPVKIVSSADPAGGTILYTTVCIFDLFPTPCRLHTFASRNRGATWNEVANAPTNASVLAAHGATVYAGGSDGLFRSSNEGADWEEIDEGLARCDVRALAIDPSNPLVLYAGQGEDGPRFVCGDVYRSVDGGAHWSSTGLGRDVTAVATDSTRVVAGATRSGFFYPPGGVAESLDGGATWTDLELPTATALRIALGSRGFSLFAGTDVGLYRLPLVDILPVTAPEAARTSSLGSNGDRRK